jgi:hypothetical protein
MLVRIAYSLDFCFFFSGRGVYSLDSCIFFALIAGRVFFVFVFAPSRRADCPVLPGPAFASVRGWGW